MDASIPDHKRQAVDRAFQSVFGRPSADALTSLKYGLSAALVLKADVGERSVLLRVERQPGPSADVARHFECLRLASDAGIAPKLLYADVAEGVSISEFVSAQPLQDYVGGRSAMLTDLGHLVRDLQALPSFPRTVTLAGALTMFRGQVGGSGLFADGMLKAANAALDRILAVYPMEEADYVPCHNDLNPTNLLYDGTKLWVVDWESGFQGDRYVDLVTLANSFAWDASDEQLMLQGLFGEVTDQHRARFILMRLICRYLGAMFMFRVSAMERPGGAEPENTLTAPPLRSFYHDPLHGGFGRVMATPEGRLSYGKAVLNEFLEGAQSSACADALVRLSEARN